MKANTTIWMMLAMLPLMAMACIKNAPPPVYGLYPPTWSQSPNLDVSVLGEFTVVPGVVSASPVASVSYYYAPAETRAPTENGKSAWTAADWTLIEDIAKPVQGLDGTHLLYGVAVNTQGTARSPLAQAAVITAIPPSGWSRQPQVDSSGVAGKFTIVAGEAIGGDPPPEYHYYYSRADLNRKLPEAGENQKEDWLYEGWTYTGTSEGLTGIEAQAYKYILYAVAINNSSTGIRSDGITFEVDGFAPEWITEPRFIPISSSQFGRFTIEPGSASGNPPPTVRYYVMKRGETPPQSGDNTHSDWLARNPAYYYDSGNMSSGQEFSITPGFYEVYAVASNKHEPPRRSGSMELLLPYLNDKVSVIQEALPQEWKTRGKGTDTFGAAITLENGHVVLTGGDFAHSYVSTNGGKTWVKQSSESGLENRDFGTLVEHDGAVYYLGGKDEDDVNGDYLSEVYESTDGGITFDKLHDAPWPGRQSSTVLSYDGKVWVMGGHGAISEIASHRTTEKMGMPDVWYTDDIAAGAGAWKEAPSPPWDDDPGVVEDPNGYDTYGAYAAGGVVFDGKMYFGGGYSGISYNKGKIWASTDGLDWEVVTTVAYNTASNSGYRTSIASMFVYQDRLFVFNFGEATKTYFLDGQPVELNNTGVLYYFDTTISRLQPYEGLTRTLAVGNLIDMGDSIEYKNKNLLLNRFWHAFGWGDGQHGGGIRFLPLRITHYIHGTSSSPSIGTDRYGGEIPLKDYYITMGIEWFSGL